MGSWAGASDAPNSNIPAILSNIFENKCGPLISIIFPFLTLEEQVYQPNTSCDSGIEPRTTAKPLSDYLECSNALRLHQETSSLFITESAA
ncbi:MAG: hypothetical protein ACRD88_20040, partial [Terriglobia bacterium]